MYKRKILCIIIFFLSLGVNSVYADHTPKTRVVQRILPAIVEVHSDRKMGGNEQVDNQSKRQGGFQYRNQPQQGQRNNPGPQDQKKEPTHIGSGFIISSEGLVITNAHVVNNLFDNGGKLTIIFHDDESQEATLVNYDEESDIALLKIKNTTNKVYPYLEWGKKPELGEETIVIGSPMNQPFSVTFGYVSSLDRFVPNAASFVPFIQTDASMNPGNSGGPLFNVDGELIGINTMIITPGQSPGSIGIGFAIDGTYAQAVIEKLKTGKKILWPYIGIMYRPLEEKDMKDFRYGYGAYIEEIVKDSPAIDVLRIGDIILKVDGKPIKWKMLATKIKTKKIGEVVNFEVLRNKLHIPIVMKLKAQ